MLSVFDHIYCIHYLRYHDRFECMSNLLSGLGILEDKHFSWYHTCDNAFYDRLFSYMANREMIIKYNDLPNAINKEGYIKNNKVFNLAMNVLNMLTLAYYLGYERILVLEDDLVFSKDADYVKQCFELYPSDYDIVSMEYWFRNKDEYKNAINDSNRKINDCFYAIQREKIVNFSCVGLSRRGIKHIIDGMNQRFICSDYYISHQDTFDDWRLKRAISKTPIAIQCPDIISNHGASIEDMKWRYDQIDLDMSSYV